jgi:vitamin B12 transporter
MVFFDTPPHPLGGVFLPPAEPSLLSTTRRASHRHNQLRTGCARSPIVAPKPSCVLIVCDSYTCDFHHRMGTWGREHREVGLDQPLLGGQALLSATYFVNTFKDLITFVSGPGPNFLNIQEAESSGIEAGVQVLLPWQLRLDGSYTFLETKVLDDGGVGGTFFPPGQPLLRRPKHQGSAGLTYLGDRWTVAFIANVVGKAIDRDFTQPGSPRVTLPGYTKLDLAASYAVLQNVWSIRNVRLQMKVDNLLNEDYEEAFGFSSPGISVRGGVAVNF